MQAEAFGGARAIRTAPGTRPCDMDALHANVVVGASQKGLMCPPGLGFCAADSAAMALASRNPHPRFYRDRARR